MGIHHTRITLFGTAGSGVETWSTSFATPYEAGSGVSDMEADATLASGLFNLHFWEPRNAELPTTTSFVGARAQLIAADGHVEVTGEVVNPTPIPGGTATASLPLECAVVCSLRTSTPGPRGRGRMYLPAPHSATLTTNGLLDGTVTGHWADSMKSFFDTWNATPGVFPVGVASMVGVEVSTVTNIRVGNVIDSQRRRRRSQPEAYVIAALA